MRKSEILHQHLGMACRQPLHESWEMENGLDRFYLLFLYVEPESKEQTVLVLWFRQYGNVTTSAGRC